MLEDTQNKQNDILEEVKKETFIVAEYIEYLRWLATEYGDLTLTANDVWNLYILGVQEGLVWSEACEMLDLPENENYS